MRSGVDFDVMRGTQKPKKWETQRSLLSEMSMLSVMSPWLSKSHPNFHLQQPSQQLFFMHLKLDFYLVIGLFCCDF